MDASYRDFSLKPCTTSAPWTVRKHTGSVLIDRLTSLPDELLIHIISRLPTKDAAVVCILLRKMGRIFPWIRTLDFDDSPISHCLKHPNKMEHFPAFVTFVDSVLQNHRSPNITRFRLGVGPDYAARYRRPEGCNCDLLGCPIACLPDLRSSQIKTWISFPLTHCGLRELDLRIHPREPNGSQLPPEIFMCETLEMLKLDVDLGLDQVMAMTSFRLPKLKLLELHTSLISEDGFVTRLVSSCPLLEDLTVESKWNHVHFTSISSPSLRRLCLKMHKLDIYGNTDFVLIHTPNLEHLYYCDNLANQYSIPYMPHMVTADICIGNDLMDASIEVSFQQMLTLIRPFSSVQHLSLVGSCMEDLDFLEVKDQLPEFPNLKYLELGYDSHSSWDKVLMAFLNCSPILETLVFPEGLMIGGTDDNILNDNERERQKLEQEFFRTTLAIIPQCCRYHLKRIVIHSCYGEQREVGLIQFLLKHASVLEDLVICRAQECGLYRVAPQVEIERTLMKLPRASATCVIQVQ